MKVPLNPIKPKRVSDQVFDQLRELIFRGEFKPGEQIVPERELAEALKWNPSEGVFPSDMLMGLQSLMPDLEVSLQYVTDPYSIKEEIASGRPVIFYCSRFQNASPHYVTVIGYNGDSLIVHGWDVSGMASVPVLGNSGGSGGCFISALGLTSAVSKTIMGNQTGNAS